MIACGENTVKKMGWNRTMWGSEKAFVRGDIKAEIGPRRRRQACKNLGKSIPGGRQSR